MRGFWHLALLKLDGRSQDPWIWVLRVLLDPQVPNGTLREAVQFLLMFWKTWSSDQTMCIVHWEKSLEKQSVSLIKACITMYANWNNFEIYLERC